MTDEMQSVAVFGASTQFGASLVASLLQEGYKVHAVFRSLTEENHGFLWGLKRAGSHLHLYEVDVPNDPAGLDAVLEGVTTIFHAMFRSFCKLTSSWRMED
jgi:NAD(P)-dependent dehydrogenase (short-subunit alcohol dehydrogenase family)